jgi:Protein kinase domain
MNSDCPARATLEAFASSALTAADSARLETHIEGCVLCAQQLDTITRSQLEDLMGSEASRVDKASRLNLDPPKSPGAIGTFAGYDVTEIAGSGAMGVVLKAHDPTLQRTVAIKVLSPSRAWDQESAERFLREARTIAAIQHDHVVVVHTAGREKGLPYLVMPFHSDGTLEGFLERTPRLAPAEVIRVGIQLARALEVTHAQGVLHRDIKPSNILLEGGLERVRLADFGLAHSLDSTRNSVAGTPQYMSPEQARGEAIDVRSDLFGLGAVLFRLATGEMVYAGKSAQEILQSAADGHVRTVRETDADLPPELAAVIDRLLGPRRDDRFASAQAVASALVRAANRRRRIVKRAAFVAAGACFLIAATIGSLDTIGKTAVINTILCDNSGDAYFIRGRFGTYAELPDAVRDAQPGDIIEVRFSGERVMPNFRTGRKPITIRAAGGFTPLFHATNNAQPFILADGPLTLEGLTLMRRAKGIPFTPLIAAENARVALLNCRLFRSLPVASDTLIKAGRLPVVPETERIFPPLILLDAKSECLLRNCLILGSHAAGMAFRGEHSRAQIANSLFAIHRAFALRPGQGFQAGLNVTDTIFLSETLIDISDPALIKNLTAAWTNCFFDLPDGAVLRVMRHGNGNWLRNVNWHESNTVYAGPVDYVAERMERRVPLQTRIATNHHLFAVISIRSALLVHAADANIAGLKIDFRPEHVGEGKFYNAFRQTSGYERWQEEVRRFHTGRK